MRSELTSGMQKTSAGKSEVPRNCAATQVIPLCLPPYGYRKDPENPKQWIIDEEAAEVVRKIYRLCIEGNGIETTARILQESGILTPTYYWAKKGIRKGGKKRRTIPINGAKQPLPRF